MCLPFATVKAHGICRAFTINSAIAQLPHSAFDEHWLICANSDRKRGYQA